MTALALNGDTIARRAACTMRLQLVKFKVSFDTVFTQSLFSAARPASMALSGLPLVAMFACDRQTLRVIATLVEHVVAEVV